MNTTDMYFHTKAVSFALLLSYIVLGARAADNRNGGCLSRLRTHTAEFKVCETHLCIMFIAETPYTMIPASMRRQDNQKLFKCKDAADIFPGFRGVFLEIVKNLKSLKQVYCVYAGNDCKFNGMVDLASRRPSPTWKYRLGVGGMAFILPHRMRPALRPLGPIMEGTMGLVGTRHISSKKPDPIVSMLSAFSITAWFSFCAFLVVLFILWVLVIRLHTGSWSAAAFVSVVNGESEFFAEPDRDGRQDEAIPLSRRQEENSRKSYKFALRTVLFSVTVCFAVTIILWEITVVFHLFEKRAEPTTLNLSNPQNDELRRYTLVHGGATETMFRREGKRKSGEVSEL